MPDYSETYRKAVTADMCDMYGHMNVQFYVAAISDSFFSLMTSAGSSWNRNSAVTDIERNKRIARELVEAMNRADTQWFLDNYADDVVVWTMGNTMISGKYTKDQVAAFADNIFEAFPQGIRFTIHGMVAEGDTVAMETESYGDHVSGKPYNNFYHMVVKFSDGKITLLKEYLDTELVTDVLAGGQRKKEP
mgnify:CR=1 FL=1